MLSTLESTSPSLFLGVSKNFHFFLLSHPPIQFTYFFSYRIDTSFLSKANFQMASRPKLFLKGIYDKDFLKELLQNLSKHYTGARDSLRQFFAAYSIQEIFKVYKIWFEPKKKATTTKGDTDQESSKPRPTSAATATATANANPTANASASTSDATDSNTNSNSSSTPKVGAALTAVTDVDLDQVGSSVWSKMTAAERSVLEPLRTSLYKLTSEESCLADLPVYFMSCYGTSFDKWATSWCCSLIQKVSFPLNNINLIVNI